MSGNPWNNIIQNINCNLDTGYKLLWAIGAIFFYQGRENADAMLSLVGVVIFVIGLFVYRFYITKFNNVASGHTKKLKPNKPKRPNNETHSDSLPQNKSGRLQFSEKYRKSGRSELK